MNRHFWQACSREAGFSFVELMVTIVIAGIAFAAIVPAFLNAQSKNSDDNMRNISLQLARDKVEKIRQLPYEQITVANLSSSGFADGQFGATWIAQGGSGQGKTMELEYTVQGYPTGAPVAQQTYKLVTVTVDWTAPPSPVLPAVVSTVIYKQFAGPQIVNFEIGPSTIMEETPAGSGTYWIVGSPTVVDAYVASSDIGSMIPLVGSPTPSPNPDRDTWGYVRFSVYALNGAEIASEDVTDPVSSEPGHYQWTWDNVAAPDGSYVFSATAFSSSAQQGNEVSYGYKVTVRTPPAPTGLAGSPGDGFVSLIWDASTIGDLDHYVVYRSTDGITYAELASDVPVANYTDDTAENGTGYSYKVFVVDTDGNMSPESQAVGPYVPFVPVDNDPPSQVTGLTVSQVSDQNALTLTWSASTDAGSPPTGVKGYDVEWSPDGVAETDWTQILSSAAFNQLTTTPMGLAWSTTYYYRVRAVDVAGNQGAWSEVAGQTTDAQPKWNLTVANANTSSSITVWAQSLTTGLWWIGGVNPSPSQVGKPGALTIKKRKSGTWYQLPQDTYNVSTGGSQPQSVTLTGSATITFSQ